MGFKDEFKGFVMKGNVVDLAVAVVIGGAFGKIVTSFVGDILMPPVGVLLGKRDFSSLFIDLSGNHYATLAEAKKAGAATLNYGVFLGTVIDFVIIAFAIFVMVKGINALKRKEEEAPQPPPEPSAQEVLLAEIRDLLKERK